MNKKQEINRENVLGLEPGDSQARRSSDHWIPICEISSAVPLRLGDVEYLILPTITSRINNDARNQYSSQEEDKIEKATAVPCRDQERFY